MCFDYIFYTLQNYPKHPSINYYRYTFCLIIHFFLSSQVNASSSTILRVEEEEDVACDVSVSTGASGTRSSKESARGSTRGGSKLSLSAKFKLDLDSLLSTLGNTAPHFVKCIKPNDLQQPENLDYKLILKQLK